MEIRLSYAQRGVTNLAGDRLLTININHLYPIWEAGDHLHTLTYVGRRGSARFLLHSFEVRCELDIVHANFASGRKLYGTRLGVGTVRIG